MNQQLFDVACFTFAGGACAGSFIGYWVRGIKERYKRAQTDRAWVASKQTPRKYDAVTGVVTNRKPQAPLMRFPSEREQEARLLMRSNKVIPIMRAKNPTPQTKADRAPSPSLVNQVREADKIEDSMHEDVVAALTAQGFKETVAIKATNACTESERATLESWMRAALANVINARSTQ
jgi:hypothetical protein